MNLEQLANLGEFAGGIAVIASLVYLALQIRQNTQSVRSATLANNTQIWSSMLLEIGSKDKLDAYLQGAVGKADMAPEHFLQFFMLARALFVSFENQYYQYLHGSMDEQIYLGYERTINAEILAFRGFRMYWEQHREDYSEQFRVYVDNSLLKLPEAHPSALVSRWQALAEKHKAQAFPED